MNTYVCRYCRQPSDPSAPTCPLCGAPVDIRESVSDSGWIQQPPIKDMAKLQFGQSHCQIAGLVLNVSNDSSTAIITRSFSELELGDVVQKEEAQDDDSQRQDASAADPSDGQCPPITLRHPEAVVHHIPFVSHGCKASKEAAAQ